MIPTVSTCKIILSLFSTTKPISIANNSPFQSSSVRLSKCIFTWLKEWFWCPVQACAPQGRALQMSPPATPPLCARTQGLPHLEWSQTSQTLDDNASCASGNKTFKTIHGSTLMIRFCHNRNKKILFKKKLLKWSCAIKII